MKIERADICYESVLRIRDSLRNYVIMIRLTLFFSALVLSIQVLAAETFINTVGSDDKIAISSFDTVAFFTEQKAILGTAELEHSYLGAKWRFSSIENLRLFQEAPGSFMPEWGGHCAMAVADAGVISTKKLSKSFEFIGGKLYLFSFGNRTASSARDSFMRIHRRWGIRDGTSNWPQLKKQLEEGVVVQPDSSNYKRSSFE